MGDVPRRHRVARGHGLPIRPSPEAVWPELAFAIALAGSFAVDRKLQAFVQDEPVSNGFPTENGCLLEVVVLSPCTYGVASNDQPGRHVCAAGIGDLLKPVLGVGIGSELVQRLR